jgi:hypothetical protein
VLSSTPSSEPKEIVHDAHAAPHTDPFLQ